MTVRTQVLRLVELGVPQLAGVPADSLLVLARNGGKDDGIAVVHPSLLPATRLAPLLSRSGRPGFVVEDMTDLDEFEPIEDVEVPDAPVYLLDDVDRGDGMLGWSPEEALVAIRARGRTPLTVSEGISWLLQEPHRLEPGRCFMCIASRKPTRTGLDSRTPAIWISGGTGRDGPGRRDAPKVGWCWARNRHPWLGFASAGRRRGPCHRPGSAG